SCTFSYARRNGCSASAYSATSSGLLIAFFFFNDTGTTEIYTLSLHAALPISSRGLRARRGRGSPRGVVRSGARRIALRSKEHTSELQSHLNLVCRLLLEK